MVDKGLVTGRRKKRTRSYTRAPICSGVCADSTADTRVTILGSLIIAAAIKSIKFSLDTCRKSRVAKDSIHRDKRGRERVSGLRHTKDVRPKELRWFPSVFPPTVSLYHDRPSSWICAQILSVLQPNVAIFLSTLSPAFTWSPRNS